MTRPCDWASDQREFEAGLRELAAVGVTHVIYGDIVYPEHRAWAERLSAAARLVAVEPLFGLSTIDVARSFVSSGACATIVAVDAARLDAAWLGTELSADAIDRLVAAGVDPLRRERRVPHVRHRQPGLRPAGAGRDRRGRSGPRDTGPWTCCRLPEPAQPLQFITDVDDRFDGRDQAGAERCQAILDGRR